jgi:hypothetical protein
MRPSAVVDNIFGDADKAGLSMFGPSVLGLWSAARKWHQCFMRVAASCVLLLHACCMKDSYEAWSWRRACLPGQAAWAPAVLVGDWCFSCCRRASQAEAFYDLPPSDNLHWVGVDCGGTCSNEAQKTLCTVTICALASARVPYWRFAGAARP